MVLTSMDLDSVVEALLFAADEPVSGFSIAEIFSEVTGKPRPDEGKVEAAIERLNIIYTKTGRSFRLHKWAGGYRMATVPRMAPFLRALFNQDSHRRLSSSLMETLAVVAYRQPVTKPEVDTVRGVDSDYALRRLVELGLIEIVGRSDSIGRPLLYGTTTQFLDQFGLADLSDLPSMRDIEDILNDPAFNRERARLLLLDTVVETDNKTD